MTSISQEAVRRQLEASAQVKLELARSSDQLAIICEIVNRIVSCYRNGNKLILMGNGGSAADAQHIAAELVGRYQVSDRPALPALAITTNTSVLTALGNDYSYDHTFVRQIEAWARPGDVLIGITTSGNSRNVVKALEAAKKIAATTVAFTGQHGGLVKDVADLVLMIPSEATSRIQEAHIAVGHIICDFVEQTLLNL